MLLLCCCIVCDKTLVHSNALDRLLSSSANTTVPLFHSWLQGQQADVVVNSALTCSLQCRVETARKARHSYQTILHRQKDAWKGLATKAQVWPQKLVSLFWAQFAAMPTHTALGQEAECLLACTLALLHSQCSVAEPGNAWKNLYWSHRVQQCTAKAWSQKKWERWVCIALSK